MGGGGYFEDTVGASGARSILYIYIRVSACIATGGRWFLDTVSSGIRLGTRGAFALAGGGLGLNGLNGFGGLWGPLRASGGSHSDGDVSAWCGRQVLVVMM